MPNSRKPHFRLLIRLTGFVVLIVVLFFIDFTKLYKNILAVNISYVLLSLAAMLPLSALKSARWYFLLRTQGIAYSYWNTLLVWLSSNFIAFITPGRLGEAAKAFYIKNDTHTSLAGSFPTVILDRLFDVYFLLIFAFIGFFRFSLLGDFRVASYVSIALVILLPWMLLIKRISLPLLKWMLRFPFLQKFETKIAPAAENFYVELGRLLNVKLLVGAALTACAYFSLFFACYLLVIAAGLSIDFVTISIFIAIANVLSFIPISISGVGTREASLIFLFSRISLSAEDAILFSSLFFFNFYLVAGLIGYVCFLFKPIRIDSLKR